MSLIPSAPFNDSTINAGDSPTTAHSLPRGLANPREVTRVRAKKMVAIGEAKRAAQREKDRGHRALANCSSCPGWVPFMHRKPLMMHASFCDRVVSAVAVTM
jgi:hypothetical protein